MAKQDKEDIIREKQVELNDWISQLSSPHSAIGDWKLNKQSEAKLLAEALPYTDAEMKEYGDARKTARVRINELQKEIEELSK